MSMPQNRRNGILLTARIMPTTPQSFVTDLFTETDFLLMNIVLFMLFKESILFFLDHNKDSH